MTVSGALQFYKTSYMFTHVYIETFIREETFSLASLEAQLKQVEQCYFNNLLCIATANISI